MSQWAEIRHLHLVERVPKKEIARRLKLDVKTVRRAISRSTTPVRVSPPRPGTLDPWRERIRQWLREEPRLTAKRIRRLLLPMAGPLPARTVRRYVAVLRAAGTRKEAFVHRSVLPGTTMEVDFGESWVDIAGVPCKVKYLVATLPFSNAYFAKAYPVERLESLLDGIESAFRYFGPRWTGQNRPFVDTANPAISGVPRRELSSTSWTRVRARMFPQIQGRKAHNGFLSGGTGGVSPDRAGAHAEDARSALTRRPFRSYPWSPSADLPPVDVWTLVRQLRGPHLST